MFSIRLNGRECISCGVCADVCMPRALALRTRWPKSVEGARLTYLALGSFRNREVPPVLMETFPYLSSPALCDGCARCVAECPTSALELQQHRRV